MEDTTISNDTPDFSLSAEDSSARRRAGNARTVHRPPTKKKDRSHTSSSGTRLGWLMLLLLIVLGSVGSWQFYTLNHQIADQDTRLDQAVANLESVTGALSATGKTLNQSDSDTKSELKVINSEIRKLWDVSNKRNRRWIEENQDTVEKLEQQITGTTRQIASAVNDLKQVKSVILDNKKLAQQVKNIGAEQLSSVARLESLVRQLTQIRQQMTEVNKQLASQKEAVKSIDAFRLQVNRKLQQLEQSIRAQADPEG
ncbi:Chromosome partition protein Smc [invertebrate metagenome]|uniref:Chromosome partition protein Smc n=1 Tax=invertebrate metagenome TaxID=1711999 RepID=A0A2H9TC02_9ZZZZ